MDEIMNVCDTLTVLRDGKIIVTFDRSEFDEELIKTSMIGREMEGDYYRGDYDESCEEEVVMEIKDGNLGDQLIDFNLQLHKGEILGVGGLSDCGMHTLGKVLFGAEKLTSGKVTIHGETFKNEADAMKRKVGYVAKDRDTESLCLNASIKDNISVAGKKIIAKIIEELIEDGDHIIVDPSSTALSIVHALRSKERLTIITNSIEVLVELTDMNTWDVISTGGTMNPKYLALVGPRAMEGIHSVNADKVILSCKGMDMERGVTDANEMFSQVKQTMMQSARMKILAADHTKFDVIAFSHICDITDVDMVVTDIRPSDVWMSYFEEKGIECRYGS